MLTLKCLALIACITNPGPVFVPLVRLHTDSRSEGCWAEGSYQRIYFVKPC